MNPSNPEKENTEPASDSVGRNGKWSSSPDGDSRIGSENKHGNTTKSKQAALPRIPEADDFTLLKPISRGAFGKVFIGCKKKDPDKIYAIKVMKKTDLINKNLIAQVTTERDALAMIHSPFVVEIYYSLQSQQNIYLVMEYLAGGDVKSLLAVCGYLEEDVAAMYVAEVTLALEYLHHKGIIHRDLKPDNMLIAANGHIKLTDFGLSKVTLDVSTTPMAASQLTPMSRVDQYRTPGQILSLRSSLAFSAPWSGDTERTTGSNSGSTRRLVLCPSSPSTADNRETRPLKAEDSSLTATADVRDGITGGETQPHRLLNQALKPRNPVHASATSSLMKSLTPTLKDSLQWKHSLSLEGSDLPTSDPSPTSSSLFPADLSYIHGNHPLHDSSVSSSDDVFPSTQHYQRVSSMIVQTPGEKGPVREEHGHQVEPRQETALDSTPHLRRAGRCISRWRSFRETSPPANISSSTRQETESTLPSSGSLLQCLPQESQSQTSERSLPSGPQPSKRKRGYEAVVGPDVGPDAGHTGLTQEVRILQVGEVRQPTEAAHAQRECVQLEMSMDCENCDETESRPVPCKVRIRSHSSDSCQGDSPHQGASDGRHGTGDMGVAPLPGSNLSGVFAYSVLSSPETEGEDPNTSTLADTHTGHGSSRSLLYPQSALLQSEKEPAGEDTVVSPTLRSPVWTHSAQSAGGQVTGFRDQAEPHQETDNTSMSVSWTPAIKTGQKQPKSVDFLEEGWRGRRRVRCVSVRNSGNSQGGLHSDGDCTGVRGHLTPHRQVSMFSDFMTPQRRPLSLSQLHRTPKEGVRRGPEPNPQEERILGTPDYLAPEILLQEKHGPAVDWWALGVCLFEFLTGLPPFNDETPELVFNNILTRAISWPRDMEEIGEEAQRAINAMLTMDPSKRPTASEVKAMALFSKLDWNRLLETEPPFVPQPDDILDTSYFDPKNTLQQLTISAVDM